MIRSSAVKLFLSALILLQGTSTASEKTPPILNAHPQPQYGPAIPFRKIPGTTGTMALEVAGNRLYTLEQRGLAIYDISEPAAPKKLGFIGGMGNVRQLQVRGKTAFLTSRQCGLWAVDVSDDANPKIISNFDGVEMATGLDVAGNVAFLGHRVYGIQCVDVSDPARMKHLSSLRTDESQSVHYRDGLLLSGDWAGGEVTVIDVSDILKPKITSSLQLDGYGDGMAMKGNLLFAATGQHKKSGPEEKRHGTGHGLDIFDLSDPKNPVKLSKVAFPDIYLGPSDHWTPRISGNHCFASDTVNGLFLVDVADPKNPKIEGNLILPKIDPENPSIRVPFKELAPDHVPQGDPVSSIAVGNGVLYISGSYTGIYIAEFPGIAKIETRDFGKLPQLPATPVDTAEEGFHTSGPELANPTRAVAIRGDIAYTANVWDGVKVHRLTENGITPLGKIDIPYAADIKIANNRAYVAEGQNGLAVYEILSDLQFKEISRLPILEQGLNFVQFLWPFEGSDIVAATCATSRINFVDFTDLSHPKVVYGESRPGLLYGNYASQSLVKDRYFGLSLVFAGLSVFDLKDNTPKTLWHDGFPLCSQTGSIAAFGNEFLVMRGGGYAFIDPENPTPTQKLQRHRFPGQETLPEDVPDASPTSRAMFPKSEWEGLVNVDAKTAKVAVANRMFMNCRTYDFSDKDNPEALRTWQLKSHPNVPAFWNGKLVLPCGYAGLLLEK